MKLSSNQQEKICHFLTEQPVLRAYLFGSFVRGEATNESDVDLLVELDYSQPIGLKFVQMKFDLEEILGKKVDLVSIRAVSKFLKPIIEAEKILIFEKNPYPPVSNQIFS